MSNILLVSHLTPASIPWVILGALVIGALLVFLVSTARRRAARPARAPQMPLAEATAPALTEAQRAARGLSGTKAFFQEALDRVFSGAQGARFFGDVEEALLSADLGVELSERIVAGLKSSYGIKLPGRPELKSALSDLMLTQLPPPLGDPVMDGSGDGSGASSHPRVVMVVGVNGSGKTTTVAKLAQRYRARGKRVLVGAADTFRAAATEQLRAWVERVGAEGVFQKEGSDPSAVAFDSVKAGASRGVDAVLLDTAGRLHTKANLMEELKKMRRVVAKAMPGAPHDVWLVVDGSTGQNALNQARDFHSHLELTGVIVTKLDGSAKGGSVLAIASELKLPVVFLGVGEEPEDLVPFNGPRFVESILAGLS